MQAARKQFSGYLFFSDTNFLNTDNYVTYKIINGRKNKPGKNIFSLTELGRQYLEDYRVVDNFLEKYGMNEE